MYVTIMDTEISGITLEEHAQIDGVIVMQVEVGGCKTRLLLNLEQLEDLHSRLGAYLTDTFLRKTSPQPLADVVEIMTDDNDNMPF